MPEYLFPFRGSTAQRLLDFKADLADGEISFTEDEAIHDVMLAIDSGRERSLRQWAERWGWSKSSVYRRWDELERTARFQREFRDANGKKLGQRGTGVGQRETQNGLKGGDKADPGTDPGQPGTDPGQSPHARGRHRPTDTEEKKSESARASEDPDFEEVKESWNEFADDVGLARIRTVNEERRTAIRLRHGKIWPHIDEIYDEIRKSDFLRGKRGDWGGADFNFVWCRRTKWEQILEGKYRNRSKNHGRTGRHGESPGESFERLMRATGGS